MILALSRSICFDWRGPYVRKNYLQTYRPCFADRRAASIKKKTHPDFALTIKGPRGLKNRTRGRDSMREQRYQGDRTSDFIVQDFGNLRAKDAIRRRDQGAPMDMTPMYVGWRPRQGNCKGNSLVNSMGRTFAKGGTLGAGGGGNLMQKKEITEREGSFPGSCI